MFKLLTYLGLLFTSVALFSAPYIAAVAYSTVSILQPQYVWFWVFDNALFDFLSIFEMTAGMAIVAWLIQMLRGNIDWKVYNNGIFWGMLVLLVIYYLSNLMTPFPTYATRVGSDLVIGIYTTIVIMFFIVLGLINHSKALKYLIITLIAITLYYTYWANMNYLESNWSQFFQGRLKGPRGSPYKDGNIFSVLFVIGLPFIIFAIFQTKKKWQQALLIMAVPLVLHAMILCASRGALLSAGVSIFVAALMIKSKRMNIVLVLGFIVLIIDQGGEMLSRTVSTVKQVEQQAEQPLNPRLVSWGVAYDLTLQYPLLGVGPQRFLEASRTLYPGRSPHVPHNTFLNYTANLGVLAGLIYLSFFWNAWKRYKQNKQALEASENSFHKYVNQASLSSLAGFFVGAVFLDLIIFEPFYLLLLIIVANHFILHHKIADDKEAEPLQELEGAGAKLRQGLATKARHARV